MVRDSNSVSQEDFVEKGQKTQDTFELPSGYLDQEGALHKKVVLREMTGAEEDLIVNGDGNSFFQLVERCTVKIGDFIQNDPNWTKILKSLPYTDHVFIIMRLRAISLGRNMTFSVQCPACSHKSNQMVDIFDFKIEGIDDPKSRKIPLKLPSGKKVLLHPATILDEERCRKIKQAASREMLLRLESLDEHIPTLEMVQALSFRDRSFLRNFIKKMEGVLDNEVEMTCPHCQHEFKSAIDLYNPNFFFPSEI